MRFKTAIPIELDVHSFGPKGDGRATYERVHAPSLEVSVPQTIPGERVQMDLMGKRARIGQGKVSKLLISSGDRISAPCPHFGACGGCSWQHLSYDRELQEKEALITRCFPSALSCRLPIIPCTPSWHYRNKMEFTFSPGKLGLYRSQSHGLVDIQDCRIAPNWFNEALAKVKAWWISTPLQAYHPRSNRGALRTLTLREGARTGDRMVFLTVSGEPDFALTEEEIDGFAEALKGLAPVPEGVDFSLMIRTQKISKGTPTYFEERLLAGKPCIKEKLNVNLLGKQHTLDFQIAPSSFFQPNSLQAEKLYGTALSTVLSSLDWKSNGVVYDLYCGTGTLGMFASLFANIVIGIELNTEAVKSGLENIQINGLEKVRLIEGDVGKVLERENLPKADLIIVDPPRAGLDPAAIAQLLRLKAPALLYISCNPLTQAQNIEKLAEAGYELCSLQPVDQFPHTPHLENIALLKWRNG